MRRTKGRALVNLPKATITTETTDRRGFIKRAALLGMAVSALALLARRPFGDPRRKGRTIPADLPGPGSIFQPRDDIRRTR